MAFDFSKYIPAASTPDTLGALPAGVTPQDVSQMYSLQMHPVENPDDVMIRDTDGNVTGSMKDLNADGYATQKAQWDEQQKLAEAGLLSGPQKVGGAEGGDPQTVQWLGSAAPAQLSGHNDYNPALGLKEGQRLVYAGDLNDSTGTYKNDLKLLNDNAVYNDPNWGKLTYAANVDHKDGMWDMFWKVAPMLPGLFAMGAPALFGGLTGAGGATAGGLVGNQTSGMFGGALNTGVDATAGSLLSDAPAWFAKQFPELVKGSISGLNSSKGKLNPLSMAMQLAGGIPGASSVMPFANMALTLGRGGGFDFSKFLPQGISMLAKGLR
jgi:hypothetical protein